MDYLSKCNKLINHYMIAFIVNTIFFIISVSLNINKSILIILSILMAGVSIVIYNLLKKNNKLNTLSFYILTIAISSSIAAVYTNSNYEYISIPSVIVFLLIIELFYFFMKILINKFTLYKSNIFISLLLGILLIVSIFYLGKFDTIIFDSLFWLVIFYSIIFFTSFITIIFLKDDSKFHFILMISYFFIFVMVFILAISIISEDGSLLDVFSPDITTNKKNKKINR